MHVPAISGHGFPSNFTIPPTLIREGSLRCGWLIAPLQAGLVDEAGVLVCHRGGAAIDLVLDRPQLARSQFVFTTARGRPAVWWQTQKTVQSANPGARVPRGRAAGPLTIVVDTREKYGWKFANRLVTTERRALPAGDYGALVEDQVAAVVECKSLANLANLPLRRKPRVPDAAPGRMWRGCGRGRG